MKLIANLPQDEVSVYGETTYGVELLEKWKDGRTERSLTISPHPLFAEASAWEIRKFIEHHRLEEIYEVRPVEIMTDATCIPLASSRTVALANGRELKAPVEEKSGRLDFPVAPPTVVDDDTPPADFNG